MASRVGLARRRPVPPCEPDLSPVHLKAVIAAVRWSWAELCRTSPEVASSGEEEAITERLQGLLNEVDATTNTRRAPGLELFETVNRGAKVTSASGRNGKQPDLAFRPPRPAGVRNLGHWGLFVECKIIDGVPHHAPQLYCTHGVARFTCGDYAPQMRTGMLLAYVRDGRRPYPALEPLLVEDYATLAHDAAGAGDETRSVHGRASCGCVDIALAHVWLPVISPAPPARRRAPRDRL